MKVIHFTNNLVDGAGKAAYRLHKSLSNEGIDSLMIVAQKSFQDDTVVQVVNNYNHIDKNIDSIKGFFLEGIKFLLFLLNQVFWYLKIYKWKPLTLFNFNLSFVSTSKLEKYLNNVDIICLYSIQSFLSTKIIRNIYNYTKAPIVWTPMDLEPLTGGCHFNNGCEKFYTTCGNCPQLGKGRRNDISKQILNNKKKHLEHLPITVVACTSLVEQWVRKSVLFKDNRIEKIFLGIDNSIFKNIKKDLAREILNFPKNKKIIFFGCFNLDDPRKGGSLLVQSMNEINNNFIDNDKLAIVTIGRKNSFQFSSIPFENIHLGLINDDRILSLLYNAVDVVAVPSIDDLGPLMVSEVIMCKTPVVTFNIGIATDIIKDNRSGYIAENFDVEDYSKGLLKFLTTHNDIENIDDSIINKLTIKNQTLKYRVLFEDLL